MRKASKKNIAIAKVKLETWKTNHKIAERIADIKCKQGRATLEGWLDDLASRVDVGDLSICTQSFARSVVRAIENFEDGYYIKGTDTGGFQCATYTGETR